MRGTIERMSLVELCDGIKYLSLSIGGQEYSLWDKQYFEAMKEGARIDYDLKESGRFRCISRIGWFVCSVI